VGLRIAALLSTLLAGLWLLGVNGLGVLSLGSVPRWLEDLMFRAGVADWSASPTAPAVLSEQPDNERLFRFYEDLNGITGNGGQAPEGYAEVALGTQVQLFDPSTVQRVCFLAVQVGVLLGMAWVWWTLGSLVAAGRSATPFTAENARRLAAIGLVVLIGGTVANLAEWLTLHWMVNTSSVADRVRYPSFGILDLPWWSVAFGASVLVLASVWRRGVSMQYDVEALV